MASSVVDSEWFPIVLDLGFGKQGPFPALEKHWKQDQGKDKSDLKHREEEVLEAKNVEGIPGLKLEGKCAEAFPVDLQIQPGEVLNDARGKCVLVFHPCHFCQPLREQEDLMIIEYFCWYVWNMTEV